MTQPASLRHFGPAGAPPSRAVLLWAAVAIDLALLAFNDWMIGSALAAASPVRIEMLGTTVSAAWLSALTAALVLGTLTLCSTAMWVLVGVGNTLPDAARVRAWMLGFVLCSLPLVALWFKAAGLAMGIGHDLSGFVVAQTLSSTALLIFPFGLFGWRAATLLNGAPVHGNRW